MGDEDLLDLFDRERMPAIERAVDRHGARLLGRLQYHARVCRLDVTHADDVFQEAFLQLLDPSFRAGVRAKGGEILPYLSKWGYWRLKDLRQDTEEPVLDTVPADPIVSEAVSEKTAQRVACVQRTVLRLSPVDRDVLRWRYEESVTEREVADRLGISLAAAKKRAHDARARLEKLLVQEGIDLTRR